MIILPFQEDDKAKPKIERNLSQVYQAVRLFSWIPMNKTTLHTTEAHFICLYQSNLYSFEER